MTFFANIRSDAAIPSNFAINARILLPHRLDRGMQDQEALLNAWMDTKQRL